MPGRDFSKYLTYSAEDISWQCFGTTAGFARSGPYEAYPPHPENHPARYTGNWEQGRTLAEYAVVYITRGTGHFRSRDRNYPIREGTAILLLPGVEHWYAPDQSTGWDEYWVGFQGTYIDKIFAEGFFDVSNPVLDIGLHPDIIAAFRDIFELSQQEKPGYQLQIGALIIRILAELISYRKSQNQPDSSERIVEGAKSLFLAHLNDAISIEDIANDIGISPAAFRNTFKNYTGMSPYQYYLHLKVNRSKELLEAGDLSIKEIAYKLNFKNPYHFSKLFKSKTGMAPSQWKQSGEN